MGVVSELGINFLASLIYDIMKRFFCDTNKKNKTFTIDTIKSELIPKLAGEYSYLLQSAEFDSFLQTPIIKDIIENYLLFVTSGSKSPELASIKNPITEDEIINYLADRVVSRYDSTTIPKPTYESVRSFFHDYFTLATAMLIGNLDNQSRMMVYFINRRIIEMSEMMKKMLTSEVVLPQKNYDEVVENYHKVLRENNSSVHVYLLDIIEFEKFYVPPRLEVDNSNTTFPAELLIHPKKNRKVNDLLFDDWKHIFDNSNIVYIIGGAGFGKSLFLKKIINDYNQMSFLSSSDYLVIHGDLKTFYSEMDGPISVVRFLQKSMMKETLIDDTVISLDLIEYYVKSGRCLVLLDALDEVEKQKRVELHKRIITFFRNQNPNNKICITSRDSGFIPEKDVETYRICPLDKSQIEAYVDKIIKLKKFDKNDKNEFLCQSETLMEKGFLSSFLILSLLINIYKAERELPENKLDLYQKCFEYIALKREKEKTKEKSEWQLISLMMKDNTFMELAKMCFPNNSEIGKNEIEEMLCSVYRGKYESEAKTAQAAECFLDFCSDRTELFVPASKEGTYRFFHRSFFDYFFSLYIFYRKTTEDDVIQSLLEFDVDSEVFELTLALIKQKNEELYQGVIRRMLAGATVELKTKGKSFCFFNILTLAMQVVDDSVFKNEYYKLFYDFCDLIAKSTDFIPNHQVIFEFMKKNGYSKQIIAKYKNYAQLSIVKSFFIGLPSAEKAIQLLNDKEHKEEMFKVYFAGFDSSFFSRLYIETDNYSSVVYDLTNQRLEELLDACKSKKNEKTKYLSLFSKFDTKSEEEKTTIKDVIFKRKYGVFLIGE